MAVEVCGHTMPVVQVEVKKNKSRAKRKGSEGSAGEMRSRRGFRPESCVSSRVELDRGGLVGLAARPDLIEALQRLWQRCWAQPCSPCHACLPVHAAVATSSDQPCFSAAPPSASSPNRQPLAGSAVLAPACSPARPATRPGRLIAPADRRRSVLGDWVLNPPTPLETVRACPPVANSIAR